MRIVVFGAGSLGTAIGALLARKNEVVLVGRPRNVSAIRERGVRVVGDIDLRVEVEARASIDGIAPPELLIVSTKSYDTAAAIEECRDWVGKDTKVLTLQNGLGNLELLRDWRAERAFGGTTTLGANLLEPGKVRLSGLGKTVIGSDLDQVGAKRIAEAFSAGGMPASVAEDVLKETWAKAVVSSCVNPLTAILRVPNGSLLESPATSRMLSEVCRECVDVANAHGIRLSHISMIKRVRTVARDTRSNRSSMLQDVERGKRTEIAYINGAIVRHGLARNVKTPLNLTLLAMVESLERQGPAEKG